MHQILVFTFVCQFKSKRNRMNAAKFNDQPKIERLVTYNLRINRNLIITRVSSNTPRFSSTKLEAHKGVARVQNRAKPCVYDASVNGASDSRRLCGRRPPIWIPRDI